MSDGTSRKDTEWSERARHLSGKSRHGLDGELKWGDPYSNRSNKVRYAGKEEQRSKWEP